MSLFIVPIWKISGSPADAPPLWHGLLIMAGTLLTLALLILAMWLWDRQTNK